MAEKITIALLPDEAAIVATILDADITRPTLVLGTLLDLLAKLSESRRLDVAHEIRMKMLPAQSVRTFVMHPDSVGDLTVREFLNGPVQTK